MSFASKVIVITGATGGIGEATAKIFAKHGAMLTITGRNEAKLSKVSQECKKLGAEESMLAKQKIHSLHVGTTIAPFGIQVLKIIADQKNMEDLEKIIKKTVENFRKLNVLVNNAGFIVEKSDVPLEHAPIEMFDEIFQVNVKSHFHLTQLAIPHLEKTNGSVINITGVMGSTVGKFFPMHSMAKSSMEQFTKLAALSLASKGIRVNSVSPGSVKTNILVSHDCLNEKDSDKYFVNVTKLHPLGNKIVEADEIASSILFLSSDDASAITGTCLYVDRGRKIAES